MRKGVLGAFLALSVVVPGIAVAGPRAATALPANTSPPTISGTPQAGSTLSASTGTWSGAPTSYSYQWRSCGGAAGYGQTIQSDSPSAYWRLGETSGTQAADASGGGHSGSYLGSPQLGVPGAVPADTAVAFNGSSQEVAVPDSAAVRLNGSFTIEFWAKVGSFVNTWPGILKKGASGSAATGYLIWYGSDLRPTFKRAGYDGRKTSASGALSTSAFRYYAVTYDASSSSLRWYVDGAPDTTYSGVSLPTNSTTANLELGTGDQGANETLDEVAFYARPLGAAAIASHFSAASGCTNIAGAASQTYTPSTSDIGLSLQVVVTASNADGSASARSDRVGPVTSASTSPSPAPTPTQSPASKPALQTAPTVSGAARENETLTATPGSWGGSPTSFGYQWQRCGGYAAQVLSDAPVGYWRLAESSGSSASDSSGAGNTGQYLGGTVLGATGGVADSNGAALFDGTSAEMSVQDAPSLRLNGSFSIEFWAKLKAFANTWPGVLRKGSSGTGATGYLIWYGSDLRPTFKRAGVDGRKVSAAGALSTGGYKDYVVTYDAASSTLRWFVNGALDTSYTGISFSASSDTAPLELGRGGDFGNEYLDDVSLYASALSPSRVSMHYAAATRSCNDITGATSSTYKITSTDVGTTLRVAVTASNAAGSATATSTQTSPVAAAATPSPGPTPSPAPTSSSDPVIAAAGDISCDPLDPNFNGGAGMNGDCEDRSVANLLTGQNLAALLPVGDVQYDCGPLAAFQQAYDKTWGRFKSISHPVVGNHEFGTEAEYSGQPHTTCDSVPGQPAAGYYSYWGALAGDPSKGYYSYDIGSWHLIALNSTCNQGPNVGCVAGSPQEQWLRNDLATHSNYCTLAYWHIPRFTSGSVGNNANYQAFWDDLYNAKADVIVNAHAHVYERFALQSPAEQPDANGIREFIAGTGGSDHHLQLGTVQPTSQVRDTSTYGVLELTLHSTGYDWRFIPNTPQGFTDSGSGSCH